MNAAQALTRWPDAGSSRVPVWAYTDAQIYQRGLDTLFYGKHWCYVGLAIQIPNAGDYRLTLDPGIRVVKNRCAHRGVRFGHLAMDGRASYTRSFICPYHRWTCKPNGDLARPVRGYLALYSDDEVADMALLLAVRHQREQDGH